MFLLKQKKKVFEIKINLNISRENKTLAHGRRLLYLFDIVLIEMKLYCPMLWKTNIFTRLI